MTSACRIALLLLACAVLSACGTLQFPVFGGAPTPSPTPTMPEPTPTSSVPVPDLPLPEIELKRMRQAPSVMIEGRTAQAIFDDIERYRTSRGMTVVVRNKNRIEFAAGVVKAKRPTQARIRYMLAPVKKGFKLSARVYQVSYPGTSREKVADITSAVADRLNAELSRYSQEATAWR